MKNNIATVIVTYNRRALLLECLKHLARQTVTQFDILVVDNASSDGTDEALAPLAQDGTLIYLNTGENLGGAGGFSFGINQAVRRGYDYIWLMDDDTFPHPDALERLLAAGERLGEYGFLSSRALWTDGQPCRMNIQKKNVFRHLDGEPTSLTPVGVATFVSLFLCAETVRQVGLPIAEFFIWTDDVEYTDRISSRYPCYLVPDSRVTHAMSSNIGVDLASEESERLERYRCCYRNEVYLYRRHGPHGFIHLFTKDLYHAARILLFSKSRKIKKLRVLLGGVREGLSFHPQIRFCGEAENE